MANIMTWDIVMSGHDKRVALVESRLETKNVVAKEMPRKPRLVNSRNAFYS